MPMPPRKVKRSRGPHEVEGLTAAAIEAELMSKYPPEATPTGGPSSKRRCTDGIRAMVSVLVGPEKTLFLAPKMTLCRHSDFFRAMLKGRWSESENDTVSLEDDDPITFTNFLGWVRGEQVHGASNHPWMSATHIRSIIELYIFADRYQSLSCKLYCAGFVYDNFNGITDIYLTDLESISDLPAHDPMYQILVDWCMVKPDKMDEVIDMAPQFARTLFKAYNAAFKSRTWALQTREDYLRPLLSSGVQDWPVRGSLPLMDLRSLKRVVLPRHGLGMQRTDPVEAEDGTPTHTDPTDAVIRSGRDPFVITTSIPRRSTEASAADGSDATIARGASPTDEGLAQILTPQAPLPHLTALGVSRVLNATRTRAAPPGPGNPVSAAIGRGLTHSQVYTPTSAAHSDDSTTSRHFTVQLFTSNPESRMSEPSRAAVAEGFWQIGAAPVRNWGPRRDS